VPTLKLEANGIGTSIPVDARGEAEGNNKILAGEEH
jgi:hypothetical protein